MASYLLIGAILFINYREKLKITKRIITSFSRMSIQLFGAGLVLFYVFKINSFLLVTLIFVIMVGFAMRIVISTSKVKFKHMNYYIYISILSSATLITLFLLVVIIHLKPFYEARYAIPLAGMVIGNSMNAITIAVERMFNQSTENKSLIESMLSLGATPNEAISPIRRNALRAALLPSLASASGMGIVFLPGMMTGQILSGVSPVEAVIYQIIIVIAINTSIALSVFMVVYFEGKSFFNEFSQFMRD